MFTLEFEQMPYLQAIPLPETLVNQKITFSVLRLDVIHSEISGNKWFKLKNYLNNALLQNCQRIVTFGGPFSNHILATAAACQQAKIPCLGIIRGEKVNNYTLAAAVEKGMALHFVSREAYKNKRLLQQQLQQPNDYFINEGGYGHLGALGAKDIHSFIPPTATHILAAVGTGTMAAGLLMAAEPNQTIIAIPVLKGADAIQQDIAALVNDSDKMKQMVWKNEYHFGGYAKHPAALIQNMNEWWNLYQLPTDIVYTAKLIYATRHLMEQQFFPPNSHVVAIHSGGLQGNTSLSKNILQF